MTQPIAWLAQVASRRGLRYQPAPDERWIRVWEPYVTLRVAESYEHALESTGVHGSITVSMFSVRSPYLSRSLLALVQDPRIVRAVAVTNEVGTTFREDPELLSSRRTPTGDAVFDSRYATFRVGADDPSEALSPSLRKLLLGWNVALHLELRPGAFVFAPVGLPLDARSVDWVVEVLPLIAQKAQKSPGGGGDA